MRILLIVAVGSLACAPATAVAAQIWAPKPTFSNGLARALAFDPTRERMVLVTSVIPGALGTEQWEHDGATWIPRDDQRPPADGNAMIVDELRQRLLLVGADTWEWDGVAWTQLAAGPGLGFGFGLAWDATRGRAVAFGGYRNGVVDETWEWDGTGWGRRAPATSPPARVQPAMAYDAARQRVVLFGGADSFDAPVPLSDTWEWDGANWSQRSVATAPPPRHRHAMVFDEIRQNVVLFGGEGRASTLGDTWTWDGNAWTPLATATAPEPRQDHVMAFDRARGRVLLTGGPLPLSDVWEWNGASWRELPSPAPERRAGHAMAWDPVRQGVLCFGGGPWRPLADTWLWDGETWRQLAPAHSPQARWEHAMALDSNRQRVILFGGYRDNSLRFGDTWEWDGSDWLLRSTTGPGARYLTALAYDAARQRVVLFGGLHRIGSSDVPSDDTWEWDGVAWTQRSPPTVPEARYSHAMSYDEARRRTVMLGGLGPSGASGAMTWEYDGATWTQRVPAPATFYNHRLVYDSVRRRVVLTGGKVTNSSQENSCAYEWDGSAWMATWCDLGRSMHGAAYDPARERVVVFGGGGLAHTAVYGGRVRASVATIGAGCAGQSGVPQLVSIGLPALGRASFGLDLVGAHPGSVALLPLALGPADIPLPGGCRVRIDPGTVLLAPWVGIPGSGFATLRLSIPATPALSGLALYAQALVAEPPTLRLVVSAGLRLGVGD